MKDNTIPLTLIGILADGEFHSGEQLGEQLGMSRAAINKHIQTLRDWGVDVFTVPGKGYSLPEPIQLLNEELIRSQIGHGNVAVLPVIDSTNQYLLERIGELESGDACVAEYQQAGRGRRGRKWFSPFGANLYLSMYWRLEQGPAAAVCSPQHFCSSKVYTRLVFLSSIFILNSFYRFIFNALSLLCLTSFVASFFISVYSFLSLTHSKQRYP